jgi:hypothetical protein
MALSREQFDELRKKGLSAQQIAEFEKRQKPVETNKAKEVKLWDTSGFESGAKGIAKGFGQFGLGIGTIGRSIQKGVGRAFGQDVEENSIFDTQSSQRAEAEETLRPKNTGERISKFTTEVGLAAAPSGAAQKATAGLSFTRAMLGRAAVGGVIGTVQGGGDVDRDTAIGAATEVAFPIVGKALKVGGNVLKNLAGFTTGTGSEVIEQVLKTPTSALAGGADESAVALRKSANAIREGTRQLQKNAGDDFARETAKYTKQLDKDDIVTRALQYIDNAEADNFKIDSGDMDKLRKVVNNWDDFSAKGVNGLGSRLSEFYSGSANSVPEDRIVSGLNRTVRGWVGEQIPEIAEANAKYADKMDLLEQMNAIFKTKGNLNSRDGVVKTSTAISRLFNANKDLVREGVEELEQEIGTDILGREAGRQLAGGITKFQAGAGDVVSGGIRSLIPRKTIMQLTAITGMSINAIESRLSTVEPIARQAVVEVLTDLLGEGEGQDPEEIDPQKI